MTEAERRALAARRDAYFDGGEDPELSLQRRRPLGRSLPATDYDPQVALRGLFGRRVFRYHPPSREVNLPPTPIPRGTPIPAGEPERARLPQRPGPFAGPDLSALQRAAGDVGGYVQDWMTDGVAHNSYQPFAAPRLDAMRGRRAPAPGLDAPALSEPLAPRMTMQEAGMLDWAPPLPQPSVLEPYQEPLGIAPRIATNAPPGVEGGRYIVADAATGEGNRRTRAVDLPPLPQASEPSFAELENQAWQRALLKGRGVKEPRSPQPVMDGLIAAIYGRRGAGRFRR